RQAGELARRVVVGPYGADQSIGHRQCVLDVRERPGINPEAPVDLGTVENLYRRVQVLVAEEPGRAGVAGQRQRVAGPSTAISRVLPGDARLEPAARPEAEKIGAGGAADGREAPGGDAQAVAVPSRNRRREQDGAVEA